MKIKRFLLPAILFAMFAIYTVCVKFVDVAAIGPEGSEVGFSAINGFVAGILGYNKLFYTFTKLIAAVSFLYIAAFALLGLISLIKEKSFAKVDFAIYAMAVTYIITALFYLLFEIVIVNYRPIIRDEGLEASFPSSHTMLAVAVFGSAIVYAIFRIKEDLIKKIVIVVSALLAAGMALGRLISGVHWFTDILGGALLGCAIVSLYMAFVLSIKKEKE
jgi:undecaprenyl-diphosphatase